MDARETSLNAGITAQWAATAPYLKGILRIVAAFMFIQNGSMKLFGWPMEMPPGVPPLEILSMTGIGGILEFIGGLLLLFGFFTRPVAFILAGQMAIAFWKYHFNADMPWPMMNGGTDAVLYCFLWLYYSASGPGRFSIDEMNNR
jgi:putative oxidoreductase